MNILIVSGDVSLCAHLQQQLTELGNKVSSVNRGFEALDVLGGGNFGMMLTCRNLPDMEGLDLVRLARRGGVTPYLYIMLMSPSAAQHEVNAALSAGADDHITQPVDNVELSLRVRNAERIVAIDTRDDAIIAMAKLAESRDANTGRHVERVRHYSRELSQAIWEMGAYPGQVDATFVEMIFRTAALHDLGKIAIPDAILLKPGRLSAREYDVMKQHTIIGSETLASVLNQRSDCRFLRMGHDIALNHHERFDGTGYPHGKSGQDIPLCARIVSVADVYDALTSVRPYKPAFSHDEAMRMIVDGAGTQFDPAVVEAMAAIERQVRQIRQREADPEVIPADAA